MHYNGRFANKYCNDMKEKIRQILNKIESGELALHDAETKLLDLFVVMCSTAN